MATRGGRNSLAPSRRNFYQQPKRRRKDLRAASVRGSSPWGTCRAEGRGEHLSAERLRVSTAHPTPSQSTHCRHGSAHAPAPASRAPGLKSPSTVEIYHCKRQHGAKPSPCQEPPVPSLARHRGHEEGPMMGLLRRGTEPARNHPGGRLTHTHSLRTAARGAGGTTRVFGFGSSWERGGEAWPEERSCSAAISYDLLDKFFSLSSVSHETGRSEIVRLNELSAPHHWKHKAPFFLRWQLTRSKSR